MLSKPECNLISSACSTFAASTTSERALLKRDCDGVIAAAFNEGRNDRAAGKVAVEWG